MNNKAELIIRSRSIFTGRTQDEVIDGFIAIREGRIMKLGRGDDYNKFKSSDTIIRDVGSNTVSCGFVDNHVFFTGYVWQHLGFDASGADNMEQALEMLDQVAVGVSGLICGHGLNMDDWTEEERSGKILSEKRPSLPIAIFNRDRTLCWMNDKARQRYGFNGDDCYAEVCYRLLNEIIRDRTLARSFYNDFQDMLAAKGITAIKEIAFDNYSGFADELYSMESRGELKHRVFLVSQPVGAGADMDFAAECKKRFTGDMISFMGFNIMVDGDAQSDEADLLEPWPEGYEGTRVDYSSLEKLALEADKRDFRLYMHAEGDGAVRRILNIYDKCHGKHVITDIELISAADVDHMAKQGTSAVCYVQIMNCYPKYSEFYGLTRFNKERQQTIWPYKAMLNSGVNLSFGTDLPLDVPDLASSLNFACNRRFPDGKPYEGYLMENALTPAQVLYCWSHNGYTAELAGEQAGTLEDGKWADLIILDRNLFACQAEEYSDVKVTCTVVAGRTVYGG